MTTLYETRIKSLVVAPVGQPMFSEKATEISVDDEASGEFVKVKQCHDQANTGEILLEPGAELEAVFAAVMTIAAQCRDYE